MRRGIGDRISLLLKEGGRGREEEEWNLIKYAWRENIQVSCSCSRKAYQRERLYLYGKMCAFLQKMPDIRQVPGFLMGHIMQRKSLLNSYNDVAKSK